MTDTVTLETVILALLYSTSLVLSVRYTVTLYDVITPFGKSGALQVMLISIVHCCVVVLNSDTAETKLASRF